MGAPRRKNLIKSRRRVEDDGEEEEGSVIADVEEDSLSEASAISDADDYADGEGSDGDETSSPAREPSKIGATMNGHQHKPGDSEPQPLAASTGFPLTTKMDDTEAMMNGLRVSELPEEGVAFENMGQQLETQVAGDVAQGQTESNAVDDMADKRRRDHDEYRKKRDADPAFVPNRGGFFMHDHRSAAPGQNGFRPFGRGRGRSRGAFGGPLQPSR